MNFLSAPPNIAAILRKYKHSFAAEPAGTAGSNWSVSHNCEAMLDDDRHAMISRKWNLERRNQELCQYWFAQT